MCVSVCVSSDLYAQQQAAVSVLQLPLPGLHLLAPLLLLLQLADVVHRGLQDGALVPALLPVPVARGSVTGKEHTRMITHANTHFQLSHHTHTRVNKHFCPWVLTGH